MKKFYAFAAIAMMAFAANAQNGAPLYITGDGAFPEGTWKPEAPAEFAFADGVYTIEVKDLASFKVSTAMGDWDTFNAGALTCNYGAEAGATVALVPGDANISTPGKGDWKITVAGDLSTIKMETEGSFVHVEPWELTLYLRGGMNDWGAPEEWALTQLHSYSKQNAETGENDTYWVYGYLCDGTSISAGDEFKVAAAEWSDMNIGAGDETLLPLDQNFQAFRGDNPSNFVMSEAFSGVMYMEICFETYDGHVYFSNDVETECPYNGDDNAVAEVAVENAPVVYYNLQGVRVANAENGLFIVKQGNKVSKVYVK